MKGMNKNELDVLTDAIRKAERLKIEVEKLKAENEKLKAEIEKANESK